MWALGSCRPPASEKHMQNMSDVHRLVAVKCVRSLQALSNGTGGGRMGSGENTTGGTAGGGRRASVHMNRVRASGDFARAGSVGHATADVLPSVVRICLMQRQWPCHN